MMVRKIYFKGGGNQQFSDEYIVNKFTKYPRTIFVFGYFTFYKLGV